MDAEVDGEDEIHPSKDRAERVATHVPPEVEPQKLVSDVNEFFDKVRSLSLLQFLVTQIIQMGGSTC